jgi:hypothetical protein
MANEKGLKTNNGSSPSILNGLDHDKRWKHIAGRLV